MHYRPHKAERTVVKKTNDVRLFGPQGQEIICESRDEDTNVTTHSTIDIERDFWEREQRKKTERRKKPIWKRIIIFIRDELSDSWKEFKDNLPVLIIFTSIILLAILALRFKIIIGPLRIVASITMLFSLGISICWLLNYSAFRRFENKHGTITIAIFIGAFLACLYVLCSGFTGLLNFIPASWGSTDDDGSFESTREKIAFCLSFFGTVGLAVWMHERFMRLKKETEYRAGDNATTPEGDDNTED